jgi:hypothetical protein
MNAEHMIECSVQLVPLLVLAMFHADPLQMDISHREFPGLKGLAAVEDILLERINAQRDAAIGLARDVAVPKVRPVVSDASHGLAVASTLDGVSVRVASGARPSVASCVFGQRQGRAAVRAHDGAVEGLAAALHTGLHCIAFLLVADGDFVRSADGRRSGLALFDFLHRWQCVSDLQ